MMSANIEMKSSESEAPLRGKEVKAYRRGLTWRDQNLGGKVEVIYMDEPCNAC